MTVNSISQEYNAIHDKIHILLSVCYVMNMLTR